MAINDAFPGVSGVVDSMELRKDLAGLIVRDSTGAARPGVFPGTTASLVTGTAGMTVNVAPFQGVTVRGGGPLFMSNDGVVSLAIATAPISGTRNDIVYFKQQENGYNGFADGVNAPLLTVLTGNAGDSMAQTRARIALIAGAVELATVAVPAGATATNSGVIITATHQFTAAGGPLLLRTDAERTGWTVALVGSTPAQAQQVYVAPTNTLWVWSGSAWLVSGGALPQQSWTYARANVDGGFQYPTLTPEASNTTDSSLATFARTGATDPTDPAGLNFAVPGTYSLAHTVNLAAPQTGTVGFVQYGTDGGVDFNRAPMPVATDRLTVSGLVRTTVPNQRVPVSFSKSNGNLSANTGRVVATRLA